MDLLKTLTADPLRNVYALCTFVGINTNKAMSNWKYKEVWKKSGTNFLVEVSRHSEEYEPADRREGPHRWCVYAYIYPNHPHFKAFNENDDLWQDATTYLPGHSYPSYLRRHVDVQGNVTSFQVGWDYHHVGDWMFTHDANQEDAARQFKDAEELFERLEKMSVAVVA